MQNIYNSAKHKSNHPNTKGILHNVQTAKDMGTPKVIVTSNQDAPTAQVTI
jgi:DNA-binding MurR/RpiR family transcriptional regulator